MIKKLRKKIVLYTILSVFSLLAIVLSIVNVSNFVAVAEEADQITERISKENNGGGQGQGQQGGPGSMGPGSPETMASMRYFIYSEETNSLTTFKMSAIDNSEALTWGQNLLNGAKKGWSRTTYRYLVSGDLGYRLVVVVDQARELNPSYRILWISLISSAIGLALVAGFAIFISKKIVRPIEENDNKQRRFITDAAIALKTPVSVISIDNATLTNEHGEELANKSIRKQVDKLLDLANDLNALQNASESGANKEQINLSNVLKDVIHQYSFAFGDNNKKLNLNIQDDVLFDADSGMIKKMLSETIENCLKYSDNETTISLTNENQRITIEFVNDCKGIPEGTLDRVFEKFYRLDYKDHSIYDGSGVCLSIVKEIVNKHNGRVIARGENDHFILKIEF